MKKIKENYAQSKKELSQPKNKKLKKMSLNLGNSVNNINKGNQNNNIGKTKNGRKFLQTDNDTINGNKFEEEMKINNTENNAYVIFPEIKKGGNNNLSNNNSKRNTKNKIGVSLPAI